MMVWLLHLLRVEEAVTLALSCCFREGNLSMYLLSPYKSHGSFSMSALKFVHSLTICADQALSSPCVKVMKSSNSWQSFSKVLLVESSSFQPCFMQLLIIRQGKKPRMNIFFGVNDSQMDAELCLVVCGVYLTSISKNTLCKSYNGFMQLQALIQNAISKNQLLLQLLTPPRTIPLGGQLNILDFNLIQQLSFRLTRSLSFPLIHLQILRFSNDISPLRFRLCPELLQQFRLKILVVLPRMHDFIRCQLKTLSLPLTETFHCPLVTPILVGKGGIETASECFLDGDTTILWTGEDNPCHLRSTDPFAMPLDVFLQLGQSMTSGVILDLISVGLCNRKCKGHTGYGLKLYSIRLQKTKMLDTTMTQGRLHACQSLQLLTSRAIWGNTYGWWFQLGHKIMHRRKDQQGVEATLRFIKHSSSHIRPRALNCIRFTWFTFIPQWERIQSRISTSRVTLPELKTQVMFSDQMLISSEFVPRLWWIQYSIPMQQKRALPYMEAVFRFRERSLWPRLSYNLLNSSGDKMEGLLFEVVLQLLEQPRVFFCP